MSNKTGISWTDCTDNIIAVKDGGWWCRRIQDPLDSTGTGCDNCYAAALNQNSFFGGNKLDYSGKPPELVLKQNIIDSWSRQRKPKKHFVASMTDIFGEWVPKLWHFEMLDGMRAAPGQTFQLLTKRPHIMMQSCTGWIKSRGLQELPPNIWVGCTVEKQKYVQMRLPYLIAIPAHIKFVSCEPLLEEVRLDDWSNDLTEESGRDYGHELFINHIDWVIMGGESGSKARPCNINWLRSLVKQCRNSATPVAPFVKQLGSNPIKTCRYISGNQQDLSLDLKSSKGSDPTEWPKDLQIQEFPLHEQEVAIC